MAELRGFDEGFDRSIPVHDRLSSKAVQHHQLPLLPLTSRRHFKQV
jgi:hypothetical protein